jgi:hypothetical protein
MNELARSGHALGFMMASFWCKTTDKRQGISSEDNLFYPVSPRRARAVKAGIKEGMKLTRQMMTALRGRRDLGDDDTSQDDEILAMSPTRIVQEVGAWNLGDGRWVNEIAHWMVAAGADPEDF